MLEAKAPDIQYKPMEEIYVHHMSPFLIQFTETIGIRWYGLSYLGGFITMYLMASYMAKKGKLLISQDKVADFITYGALGVLIGGRIGYVLFYKPNLLTEFTGAFPFWGPLEVHKGGMASHGGILGVMLATWLFARREKVPWLHIIDIAGFGSAIAFFYGRLANFINGELFGRIAPEGTSWAIKFPSEILLWGPSETEKLKALGPAIVELGRTSAAEWSTWITDWPMHRSAINSALYELVNATQAGNAAVAKAMGPALNPRYPSQLVQAGLEGFLLAIIIIIIWMKPQKPGVIASSFGLGYSIMRILGEQYRMPDAHLGFQLFGLTRGQWLSFGLIAICAYALIYAIRSDKEAIGGWKD